MTTEELNTLITQAENGDVAAMNRLTCVYGTEKQHYDPTQALKWFKCLVQMDNDPQSKAYHKTNYDRDLYENLVGIVESAMPESEADKIIQECRLHDSFDTSLFGKPLFFSAVAAREYIKAIQIIDLEVKLAQEEEAMRRKREEEKARRLAKEEAMRRSKEAEAKKMAEEETRRQAEEAVRKEAEARQKAIEDQKAADMVIKMIEAIGTVKHDYESFNKINQTRSAFNSLSIDQQKMICNAEVLVKAEEQYAALQAELREQHRKAKAAEEQKAVDEVTEMINAIGTVSIHPTCKFNIEQARRSYNALTSEQQQLVLNHHNLTEAEMQYSELFKESTARLRQTAKEMKEQEKQGRASTPKKNDTSTSKPKATSKSSSFFSRLVKDIFD